MLTAVHPSGQVLPQVQAVPTAVGQVLLPVGQVLELAAGQVLGPALAVGRVR
jgi:hypothetical protein